MNKTVSIAVGILLVVAFSWLVVSNRSRPAAPPATRERERVPAFSLKDYNGKVVSRADFRGKALVINSWASWCTFCREELKDFATVQKEFGDRIVTVAVNRAEPVTVAKRYSDELGVTDKLVFLLDPADSLYQAIGGFSMPETIFVSTDGEIIVHKRGVMKTNEIRQKVAELLSR